MRRRLLGVLLSAAVLLALCAGALAEGAGQAYTANLGDCVNAPIGALMSFRVTGKPLQLW